MTDLSILGSKGESKQHTPVESPDSLINISYANILDGISEGPIVGLVNGAQSIYLDKTPLANSDGSLNFTGVTWEQRTGEHDQDHISGFPAVESQSSVGVELKASQPWVQAFSNLELSAVRVQLSASALVVTEKDGDRVGYRVAYEIDLSTDDSDYKVVHSGAFDGKTTTGYQRSIRIDLPKATRGWRLRVRRTTPDSTTSNTQASTSVGTYTEIIDAKLQYPYTALCGLKIDASQFSSIPERAYRIRGRIIQVPSNYTPATRAYAGTWDGTFKLAWTDCPAWIWRDIVLNDRYGLGRFIDSSQLDKWALYQIARYCDEMVSDGKGGREPRFTCNVYLQSRADALTVLQDLASVFRGMSYYASSQVACAADMPGDPVYTYTNANVIDGKFSRAGSSGSTRFSVAKVAWSDRENFGNQRVEYVQDQKSLARYGVRETEITAFGCVSQGQAQRAGQYILLTNRLETGTITFSVGLDGTICRPGDVIRVADQHYAGAPLAGRIKAATASTVTLDDDVKVAAGDTLVVILPKGVAETRVVRSVAGRVVTVTQAFSAVPVKESVYTIETSTLVAETYRVLTVNENFGDDKLQYDVVAIARNNSKFAAIDDGAQIIIPPTSVLPAAVQAPPTNVKLSTFDTLNQGINIATMRITWDAPRGAQSYRVWWKRNSGDWVYAGVTYTAAIEVRGIYSGTYTARVSAEGVAGNSSVWALSEPTALFGKIGEPPALASLKAESLLFGIGLTWAFPPGAEDTQRTELWYSEGTDLAKGTKLADLAYPQDKHTLQGLRAGQRFYFWARLVDKSGNIGPWFPSGNNLVAGMASADAGPILEQIKDQITESELGKQLTSKIEKIELIDGNGPGSVNERVATASNAIKADVSKQLIQVNSTVDGVRSNLQGQVTAVEGRMTTARDDLQRQIDGVSSIAGALPYNKTKTYALDQAVLGANGKLYQAKKAVPVNVAPPNTDYWEDVGQSVRTANGTASAVSKLQTDVTTLGDTVTATSGKVDGFQASINTANSNASAAQGAAQAANDLAGGKGKVIVQSAAPAAADRLPQNLWIDTTSGANTPKRWNGSAWVSVSDKVATDAAAAAQSALSQVGSKADASAVNSLKLTVDQQGRDLTSQGTTLNGMQTAIDGKASSQALQQVTSRVTATEDKDKAQDQLISSQSQTLTSLKDTVAKKAEASTVTQLANDVKAQGDNLSAQGSSLTKIEASLPSISGENLLPNSSFEEVVADGSRPRHWALSGGAERTFVPSPLTSSL
ncbi:host specificity protein J, partial [Pseudomonas monteilii]